MIKSGVKCVENSGMKNSISTTSVLIFVFVFLSASSLHGQQSDQADIGVFEKFSDVMGQLISFGWNEKKMVVRKDWEDRKKRRTRVRQENPVSLRDHFELAFLSLGCDETTAIIEADKQLKSLEKEDMQILNEEPDLRKSVLANLNVRRKREFEAPDAVSHVLQVISRRVNSHSWVGGNSNSLKSFSGGEFIGRVNVEDGSMTIELGESKQPRGKLSVRESEDGELFFCFTHAELHVELRQSADGHVRLVAMSPEFVDVARAESFFDLMHAKHGQAEKVFLLLLKRMGIPAPKTKNDSEVIQSALHLIGKLTPQNKREFEKLFVELDSKTFDVRIQATKKLASKYLQLAYYVQQALQRKNLSTEATKRLKRIRKNGLIGNAERFVLENNLLDSPKYLVRLLEESDSQPTKQMIADQLEKLTKLDHGLNIDAWKSSLLDQDGD